jgi:hypothetical protein
MAGNSAEPGRSVTSKIVAILLTFHDGNEHSLTEIARLILQSRFSAVWRRCRSA